MASYDVLSAWDQKKLRSFDYTTEAEALNALGDAHQVYSDRRRWLSPVRRIEILARAQELVRERRLALTRDAAAEGGKPWRDSLVEIDRAIDGIGIAIRELQTRAGHEVPMGITNSSSGRWAVTFHEPRGVVLAISAFNHPFNLIVHQVVPAIAAGCPVVVKPATTTPISCHNLVEILYEAGLPREHCAIIRTNNDATTAVVRDPRVAFLTFIGSARVGWMLRQQLAPGAGCALEHGGVAPMIVDESADLNQALPLLLKGGFYHAGQVCVSVQRIYAHRSIAEELTIRLVEGATQLRVGDPLEETTDVGPLILPREVERVHEWVEEARARGAQVLCGGVRLGETTYAPTVVLDPPSDTKLSTAEVFGPVVCVYPYDHLDDAIARANLPNAYFQASIFTQRLDVALDASRRLNGMAVMVNDHTAFRVDWMPFGGHRESGIGVGGIGHAMREMSIERLVVFRSPAL